MQEIWSPMPASMMSCADLKMSSSVIGRSMMWRRRPGSPESTPMKTVMQLAAFMAFTSFSLIVVG